MSQGHLTKLCLLRRLIEKAHERKGKSLVAFSAKKYFSNFEENSKFTFYCVKKFFCGYISIITHFFHNFKMECRLIKLYSYIMSNKA